MNPFLLYTVFLLHLFGKVYSFVQSYKHNHIIVCTNSYTFDDIEESFVRVAKDLGYKYKSNGSYCDLSETLMYSNDSIVINFNVYNFGNVNESIMDRLNNHPEDIFLERYSKLNASIDICDEKNNQTDNYGRGCKDPDFNLKTKAFVGSVEKHGALYNVFKAITENSHNNFRKNIVVCSDFCYFVDRDYKQFSIFCQSCDEEFECYEGTVAIVVPSPEIVTKPCYEDIPVIFYDALYIEPNPQEYTNDYESSTMTVHWKALSSITNDYVIHKRRWERVAIVSDDSPIAKRLTNDQRMHFTRRNILFTIRYCSEIGEFNEALSLFNEVKVAVIIVNVAKANLATVRRSAQALGMTNNNIIWIFPGHRRGDITNFKYTSFINLSFINDYEDALKLVKNEYERSLGNEREFRRAIKNYIPPTTYEDHHNKRYIVEIPSNFGSLKSPYPGCTLRSHNFYYPCRDMPILYIILALLIFLVLVFVVLVFFNSIKMNTLEYRPLHEPPSIWSRIFQRGNPRAQRYPMGPFRRRY